eukprot:scaffold2252_cov255-Pinguiococcus_pyrenoidosus.AAC.1
MLAGIAYLLVSTVRAPVPSDSAGADEAKAGAISSEERQGKRCLWDVPRSLSRLRSSLGSEVKTLTATGSSMGSAVRRAEASWGRQEASTALANAALWTASAGSRYRIACAATASHARLGLREAPRAASPSPPIPDVSRGSGSPMARECLRTVSV